MRPPCSATLACVRSIGRTVSAPVGPYVTRHDAPDDFVQRLQRALAQAIQDSGLAPALEALLLIGVEIVDGNVMRWSTGIAILRTDNSQVTTSTIWFPQHGEQGWRFARADFPQRPEALTLIK